MRKIVSIALAVLFMSSTMGFTLATHFCKGHKVESKVLLGGGDLDCGMTKMETSCESDPKSEALLPINCCENDYLSVNIEDDYNPGQSLSPKKNMTTFIILASFINKYAYQDFVKVTYTDYNPPPLIYDIQVVNETFII